MITEINDNVNLNPNDYGGETEESKELPKL